MLINLIDERAELVHLVRLIRPKRRPEAKVDGMLADGGGVWSHEGWWRVGTFGRLGLSSVAVSP
ncbi:hypothetical protein [Streptomyces sp. NPDC059371]|uniref:hypothetical protein n=1 Tax=Streptomyces sp. NPDC059371 TaxID=3346812 RepID=UPI00369CEC43